MSDQNEGIARPTIALFVDADNSSRTSLASVVNHVEKLGRVLERRAYGNWASEFLKGWESDLLAHAIRPVQQFDLTKGKNAVDIALVIDVVDLFHQKPFDILVLVTSDCDFTPLAVLMRQKGVKVIVYGEKKAPKSFRAACSVFHEIRNGRQESVGAVKAISSEHPTDKQDKRLNRLLMQAFRVHRNASGTADMGQVSKEARKLGVAPKDYGFKKFKDLFESTGLFKCEYCKHANQKNSILHLILIQSILETEAA